MIWMCVGIDYLVDTKSTLEFFKNTDSAACIEQRRPIFSTLNMALARGDEKGKDVLNSKSPSFFGTTPVKEMERKGSVRGVGNDG